MDETFLPWWLILLLGMWATALTFWQHPRVNREVRLWAGTASVVYLGLVFLALGSSTHTSTTSPSDLIPHRFATAALVICLIFSLTASLWFVGRVSSSSRRLSYVVCTLANAGASVLMMRGLEIAVGLVIVAIIAAMPLLQNWYRARFQLSFREQLAHLANFTDAPALPKKSDEFWLTGLLSAILACTLLGTLAYSLRFETARLTASPRHTALPSRADLQRLLAFGPRDTPEPALLDLAFGRRSDIVVLLAVIVFLSLAMTRNEVSRSEGPLLDAPILPASNDISEGPPKDLT